MSEIAPDPLGIGRSHTVTSAQQIAYENYVAVSALVDELVRSGVRNFVVCPGSRSTPLALAIAQHPGAKLWMHLDERSASFFGLGMAKASGQPVVLVCTSGTAAANFMPAVAEAFYSRVPLVVLTADRPHELRDNGAPQAMDQTRLYGSHVKWFFELEEPATAPLLVNHVRTIACRAVATALRGPAGPVHINCPYREPLIPLVGELPTGAEGRPDGQPYVAVAHGPRAPQPNQIAALAHGLAGRRGLILCGPQDPPLPAGAVVHLAQQLGFPILADPLSGVRCGPHDRDLVIDSYDAILRDDSFVERFAPEIVLRFGAMPTSKPVLLYLERYPGARLIVVDDDGWNEPTLLASDMVQADAALFCEALSAVLPPVAADAPVSAWQAAWCDAGRSARAAIADGLAGYDELFEGKVFAELAELLPDSSTVFAGNSMPVRDLDTFFPGNSRSVRFLANRGVNGIDGVVSSALGASVAGDGPLVLVIGDISFFHDSNGLLAAKQHGLNATIILLNNDGGGIFSFLAQTSVPEYFEALWGTPHGLDFKPLADMYGATFTRVSTWEDFRTAVRTGTRTGGLKIIEVPTERDRNVVLHRQIWPAVSQAVARGLAPEVLA
jgi:2-succinyl-5-enolpyruvyl-6-hydroxy-3-cyclohexene-1-carboxylate synthase